MRISAATFNLFCLMLAGANHALAQASPIRRSPILSGSQVVALDECDPTTFNAVLYWGLTSARISRLGIPRRCRTYFLRRNLDIRTRTGTSSLTRSTSRKELTSA
jgi:hypothetical protein